MYSSECEEENVIRKQGRSAMQYSHFDWSKVPKAQERRLNKNCDVADKAQIVTVRFR